MKRGPKSFGIAWKPGESMRGVAGLSVLDPTWEVASWLHGECGAGRAVGQGSMESAHEAALIADFAEFLLSEEVDASELPPPDPSFRESLRRHLWRVHVQMNLHERERH
ncbi:MAG: hypothetical protein ACX98W_05540 [bacterium]